MQSIIQSLAPEDLTQASCIYQRSVTRNPRGFIQDATHQPNLLRLATQWRRMGGDLTTVSVDRQIVGIGGLHPQDGQVAELAKLHIDEAFQGRGLGRNLALHLLSLASASGFTKVILHVTATQSAAVGLYESLGFEHHRRKTYHVSTNSSEQAFDTYHMSRRINPEQPTSTPAAISSLLEVPNPCSTPNS